MSGSAITQFIGCLINMKLNKWRSIGGAFLLFFMSASWVYASGDGSHPGDSPLIVGGSFGLLFTFVSWFTADQFSRGPDGNYKAIRWLSGIALGLIALLCLAMLLDSKAEAGLKSFAVVGYIFFALPQVALILYARNAALNHGKDDENKLPSGAYAANTDVTSSVVSPIYTEDQTAKMISDYQAGVSVEEIAGGLGKSVRSVVAKLSREGVWVSGSRDRPTQTESNFASTSSTKSAFIRDTESHKSTEAGTPKKSSGTKKPRKSSAKSTVVELGVYCSDLRYSEEEHGATLPTAFKKARDLWKISGNDPSNPSYKEACKLLSKWYRSYFQIRLGFSMSMEIDQDNQMGGVNSVVFKDSTEAAEHSFSGDPQLKSCSVVFVDFRSSTSTSALREGEKLLRSPEVGVLAIYEVNLGKNVKNAEALAKLIAANESVISECFHIEIREEAIQTTVEDDDGEEMVSSSSSWSGGGVRVEVGVNETSDQLVTRLIEKIHKEHQPQSLLGDTVAPIKKLIMLGNVEEVKTEIDSGLDVNTRIDDEPLLKLSLMVAVTAEQWFNNAETSESIRQRYSSVEEYRSSLKKIAIYLLDRGADVNAGTGHISILAVAEALNDVQIATICRERADSANDPNSTPFLLAAERGDVDSLKAFLAKGARLQKRDFLHGTTPLMLACQGPGGEDAPPLTGQDLENQLAAVDFLLKQGADINAKSDTGDTAIGNAVRRGHVRIVEVLLRAGAKTAGALPRGRSLIALAKDRNHSDVVELLQSKN
jgi:hypothetical protein